MRPLHNDIPAHIVEALQPIGMFFDLFKEGDDRIIENASDWRFSDMEAVAAALGITEIDLDDDDNGKIERDGGGCDTCGHGSRLRVYGACKAATPTE